jgi:hypothetical protein
MIARLEEMDSERRFMASMTASVMNLWVKRRLKVEDLYVGLKSKAKREKKDFASMSEREREQAMVAMKQKRMELKRDG